MSNDDEETEKPDGKGEDRRGFDDVASLFGAIVPPAGTPVRPRLILRQSRTPAEEPVGPLALKLPPRPVSSPLDADQPALESPTEAAPMLPPPADEPARRKEARRPFASRGSSRADRAEPPAAIDDLPWPDAFEPRPNFRRESTNRWLVYLLLLPLILVLGIGLLTVNPEWLRGQVLHYFPQLHRELPVTTPPAGAPATADSPTPTAAPPLPLDTQVQSAPQATGATAPAGSAEPTPPVSNAPSTSSPAPIEPRTAPATTNTAPNPTAGGTPNPVASPDASAVSPAPAAPSADLTPPGNPAAATAPASIAPTPTTIPATPPLAAPLAPLPETPRAGGGATETAPQPASREPALPSTAPAPGAGRVVIHFSRLGGEDARRTAAELEHRGSVVELRTGTSSYRVPTIVYYNPLDRDEANALARSLGGGPPLAVRAGSGRVATGWFDVWLR